MAVIGLRGTEAPNVLAALFHPATDRRLEHANNGAVLFGQWANGEDVVVCRTTHQWEIQCHGGMAAAPAILEDLESHGVEVSDSWKVALKQSDVVEQAWQHLATAPTVRTAAVLLDQARGAWDRQASQIEQRLQEQTSEARQQALADVAKLRQWSDLGRHLNRSWRVALFGAPNAGKSTLINRILGYQRSVVYRQAGTTRDLVTATTVVDGWSLEFCDTAGLRRTDDALERAGTELTQKAIAESDVLVEVIDLTQPTRTENLGVSLPLNINRLRVGNKSDIAKPHADQIIDLTISAESGDGLDQLLQSVVEKCVPHMPPPGSAVPFCETCFQQLNRWETLARGAAEDGQ